MSELQQLMQNSIPCARGVLQENYKKLLEVADYCESNYVEAQDKRKALEETMAFTAQSLASVAYQISNLATDVLKILDLQATEVRQVEANVCSIAQVVEMHKEKVARREIGVLAVCKRFLPCQKITYPDHLEPLEAYYRKPLNFNSLDELGHGVKDLSTQLARTGTLSRRGTKLAAGQSSVTLGRSPCIPEPIQPPIIPDAQPLSPSPVSYPSRPEATTSTSNMRAPTEPPPPPPPPLPSLSPPSTEADDDHSPQADLSLSSPSATTDLPPPHFPESALDFPASLPPPPPLPPLDITNFEPMEYPLMLPQPPPPEIPPWAPASYLDKVVTIYPYTQQNEEELSFAEGTIIYMTRRLSDGWCEGVTSEGEGLFPGNYVEPLA